MSVILTLRYRDSEPGGGICADDAEAKAEAAKVAREVLENYNPSAEGTDELIRDFLFKRLEGDAEDPRTEQDERLGVDDLTDDEALDLAAEDMDFSWGVLPGEPERPDPAEEIAALREALETALTGVADVLAKWERGDLAGAVHGLQGWAEGTFEKFPDLEAERWIAAEDLRPGDRVDMAGVYSEETGDANAAEFEYGRVYGVERETPTCVRVDFENFPTSYGFAPDRFVKAICTAKDRAEYAEALAEAKA